MYFNGDIIITDPCYIIKNNTKMMPVDYNDTKPNKQDFLTHIDTILYPDAQKVTKEVLKEKGDFYDYNLYSNYAFRKAELQLHSLLQDGCSDNSYKTIIDKIENAMELCLYISETKNKECKMYEDALYEWEKPYMDDREVCNYGYKMENLGFTTYLSDRTRYGDWSCTAYNIDTEDKIGMFCADGGMVGVFLLEEVLRYNPDFNYHTEKSWTTTWIKNFNGDIKIEYFEDIDEVRVVGSGNINFITKQTRF